MGWNGMEWDGRRDKDVLAVMRGQVGWGVLTVVVIGDGRACFECSGCVYLCRTGTSENGVDDIPSLLAREKEAVLE